MKIVKSNGFEILQDPETVKFKELEHFNRLVRPSRDTVFPIFAYFNKAVFLSMLFLRAKLLFFKEKEGAHPASAQEYARFINSIKDEMRVIYDAEEKS